MGRPYHIISFDGGGVLGLYSATLLSRLTALFPEMLEKADLLTGTSTGGLIALTLAHGLTPTQIMDIYLLRSKEIFARQLCYSMATLWGLAGSKYHNAGLVKVCNDTFGDQILGRLPKKVLIPAFDLMSEGSPANPSWRARFFHNLAPDDYSELVSDVAIRTASAPTYFPTYQGYCDGGVFANSPGTLAIAQAVEKLGVDLADIRLLSIGTGGQIKYIDGQQLDWGLLKWVRPVVNIFMESQSLVTEATCKKFLGDRYFRLNPICPEIEMDDVSRMPDLIRAANETDLTPAIRWMRDKFLA